MSDQVVIVGGGLTGLVAAYELHAQGVRSVVLEAGDRPGGRVGTVRFPDGATAESGMEEFWETSPAYGMLRRLGLPLVEQAAFSSVVLDGRLHPYRAAGRGDAYLRDLFGPIERQAFERWSDLAARLLEQLDLALATRCWNANLTALRRMNFCELVAGLGLPNKVSGWIRIVVESETAVEWNRIAALDGIEEMRPFVVNRTSQTNPTSREGARNVRVVGGNGRLIEAMVAALPDDTVRLGARVTRVTGRAHDAAVTYRDARDRPCTEYGDHVIVTPPLWALKTVDLTPALDPRSRAAIASAAAGTYVKVVLRLRRDSVEIPGEHGAHPFALLTDGPAGCVYLADGRDAGRDHVLTMLIHGACARALTGRVPADIVGESVRVLGRLAVDHSDQAPQPLLPGLERAVTDAKVFDHPRAVAYWPHAHGRSRFDHLADALRAPHGRVLIGGDTTDSSHSDGAVQAGQRMAGQILQRSLALEGAVR
jgi:monoamine oxidase